MPPRKRDASAPGMQLSRCSRSDSAGCAGACRLLRDLMLNRGGASHSRLAICCILMAMAAGCFEVTPLGAFPAAAVWTALTGVVGRGFRRCGARCDSLAEQDALSKERASWVTRSSLRRREGACECCAVALWAGLSELRQIARVSISRSTGSPLAASI